MQKLLFLHSEVRELQVANKINDILTMFQLLNQAIRRALPRAFFKCLLQIFIASLQAG